MHAETPAIPARAPPLSTRTCGAAGKSGRKTYQRIGVGRRISALSWESMPTQSAGGSKQANTPKCPATAKDAFSLLRILREFSSSPKTCRAAGTLTRRAVREPYALVFEAGDRSNVPKISSFKAKLRFCSRLSPRTLFSTIRAFGGYSCPISPTLRQLRLQKARQCPAPNRMRGSLASETRCLQSDSLAAASDNSKLSISSASSASSAGRTWVSMPGPSSSAAFPCAGLVAANSFTLTVTAASLSKSRLILGSACLTAKTA